MDREEMTLEENYALDTGGYLVVPDVLKPEEIKALNQALDDAGRHDGLLSLPSGKRDAFRDLMVHPVLVWFLNQICGHGFRMDEEPRLIGDIAGDSGNPMVGGDEPRDLSAAYNIQQDVRKVQAVSVIWALADANDGDGGLVVVPASHKSNVPAPEDLLSLEDEMSVVAQPVLKAGDMLILCKTTIHGFKPWKGEGPQRLLRYEYVNRGALRRPGPGPGSKLDPWPEWAADESDAVKAETHIPGRRDMDPPPTINSDGEKVWVEGERKPVHPSFYAGRNPDINHKEFFLWDLNSYLVVRNVMTEEHLQLANEAIDKFSEEIIVGGDLAGGSKTQAGSGRPTLGGLVSLPEPYCRPFREMIAHPAVTSRLLWMCGSGFRTGGGTLFAQVKGSGGQSLHDGNEPLTPWRSYFYKNGRAYGADITVTWHLHGAPAGGGGFACVPGSHKTQYRMPRGVRTCDDELGRVVQPHINAGDVLLFMDGGGTHGSKAWQNDFGRRAVLIKYWPSYSLWSGGVEDPEERWGADMLEGMTEEQLSLMRGPSRDGGRGTIPRLEVEGGTVKATMDTQDRYAEMVVSKRK